jgi:CheY-like chemotaxis protein
VEQVIVNLIVNARDAMPKGGPITIETANVELDETYARTHVGAGVGRYVLITVSDTGCGIPPEILSRIFEPFFTTKEVGKGSGLGLAAVHGTVKQSGGEISVYSEPGLGTTFKIYLPRVDHAPGPSLAPAPAPLPRGTETVLVVEDNPEVLAIAREVLEHGGYRVLHAPNAAEALALVGRHPGPIHLLVADVVMPGLSGPELATQLTAARPDLLVLYMSGYTASVLDARGSLGPRTWFLEKPFAPDAFALKVREVLDTR